MLNHPTVKYRTEQAIAIVTIDRYDEARNAVNPETAQGLAQAFRAFDRDPSLSVAILAARSAPASTSSAPRPAIAAIVSRTATARWARPA
jgi:enoyl-CoA hydratase/carnithine racemase